MASTKNQPFLTPGERLKYAFGVVDVSQGEAARLVFVTPGQVSKWVLNQNAITPNAALAFEARLGIRAEWILKGEGDVMLTDRGKLSDQESDLLDAFQKLPDKRREFIVGLVQAAVLEEAASKKRD